LDQLANDLKAEQQSAAAKQNKLDQADARNEALKDQLGQERHKAEGILADKRNLDQRLETAKDQVADLKHALSAADTAGKQVIAEKEDQEKTVA